MNSPSHIRILIIRLTALGDVVQAHQALRSVKELLPHAHWTWAVAEPYLDLIRGEELVDELLPVPRRWTLSRWLDFRKCHHKQNYDLIIDAQCLIKSWLVKASLSSQSSITWGKSQSRDWLSPRLYPQHLNEAPTSSRGAFLKLVQQGLENIGLTVKSNLLWHGQQASLRPNFSIFCSLGAGWPTKQLQAEQWPELLAQVQRDCPDHAIYFLAGNREENALLDGIWAQLQAMGVKRLPALSLKELKSQLSPGDLFIGMDSGPTHLASSRGCKTLTFFGPSRPEAYDACGNGVQAPRGNCHLNQTFERRCDLLRTCQSCSALVSIEPLQAWQNFWASCKGKENT